jgi:hypothetical protein
LGGKLLLPLPLDGQGFASCSRCGGEGGGQGVDLFDHQPGDRLSRRWTVALITRQQNVQARAFDTRSFFVPAGTDENSPAIYRWVSWIANEQSRQGRQIRYRERTSYAMRCLCPSFFRPSRGWRTGGQFHPTDESVGYFGRPCRDHGERRSRAVRVRMSAIRVNGSAGASPSRGLRILSPCYHSATSSITVISGQQCHRSGCRPASPRETWSRVGDSQNDPPAYRQPYRLGEKTGPIRGSWTWPP